jgi:very-short-patch-repair endonuclease
MLSSRTARRPLVAVRRPRQRAPRRHRAAESTYRRPYARRSTDLAPFEVRTSGVLRVTDPTRTLIDYAGLADLDRVERALESTLRRRLTSVARLRWRAGTLARPGRSGPSQLLRALDRRSAAAAATGSDAETLLVQLVRAAGLPDPERQFVVRLPSGRTAVLDFAYVAVRLFMEVDGWAAHGTPRALQRDLARQDELVVLGWRPLRFTHPDLVRRPGWVAAQIRAALGLGRVTDPTLASSFR